MTVRTLWQEFVAVGGNIPAMEFDAYLDGAWVMPSQDRRVLEHVLWEMEHLG